MYFDFGDYRPDTPSLDGAMSSRERIIISVFLHALIVAAILVAPRLPWVRAAADAARQAALEQAALQPAEPEEERFVYVRPLAEVPVPEPPPRAELSDQDREAAARERALDPTNSLPFARGNSSERVEAVPEERPPGGAEPVVSADETGDAAERQPGEESPENESSSTAAPVVAERENPDADPTSPPAESAPARQVASSLLGDAIRNLDRMLETESFDNPTGGAGQFGPWIQFDTKGVEFGPWIRRFVEQVKRNWIVPYAAMTFKGHVVITFNVHKDGTLTDLSVLQPADIDAFNSSAYNALARSNPTLPLPQEYPSDRAFFTVTFFYNESPPAP